MGLSSGLGLELLTLAASLRKVSLLVGPWQTGKATPCASKVRPSSSYLVRVRVRVRGLGWGWGWGWG